MGLFSGHNRTATCITLFDGRKFYMCSLISILIQCDIVDSKSSMCRNLVSFGILKIQILKQTNLSNQDDIPIQIYLNKRKTLFNHSVAGVQAATYSYIGEFHSNETRTRALSFVAMFMPACFVYLPLLAWAIIPMEWELELNLLDTQIKILPWRLYLLISSLLNGINFICVFHLPESPKFLLSMNRKDETLIVLQRMYWTNMRHDAQVFWRFFYRVFVLK